MALVCHGTSLAAGALPAALPVRAQHRWRSLPSLQRLRELLLLLGHLPRPAPSRPGTRGQRRSRCLFRLSHVWVVTGKLWTSLAVVVCD